MRSLRLTGTAGSVTDPNLAGFTTDVGPRWISEWSRLMPRSFSCLLLAALALIPSSTLADVVIYPSISEGSTTDLFDVSQGTIVTGSSPVGYANGVPSSAAAALGGTSSFVEPTHLIFENDGTPSQSVDWFTFQTTAPIDLRSFQLILSDDSNLSPFGDRGVSWFRLLGGVTAGSLTTLAETTIQPKYTQSYGGSQIVCTGVVDGEGMQYFRLELTRTTSQGPRVIELDGFKTAYVVPEPASVVLAGLGFATAGLLAVRRRRTA